LNKILTIAFLFFAGFLNGHVYAGIPAFNGDIKQLEREIKSAIASVRPATVNLRVIKQNGNSFYNSIGSGVIVGPTGYILTNEHVVGNSQNVEVTLWRATDKKYIGRVISFSKKLDLALVRIIPKNNERFVSVKISNLKKPRTGDRVIAVGNPYGLSHSASIGIIGNNDRSLVIGDFIYEHMLQTDATINQGNSGGPLINLNGEIIGINTAILATNNIFSGQGFALPIKVALDFMRLKGV